MQIVHLYWIYSVNTHIMANINVYVMKDRNKYSNILLMKHIIQSNSAKYL